jgi:hypothetical protein
MSSEGFESRRSSAQVEQQPAWFSRAITLLAAASCLYACSDADAEGGGVSDAGRGGSGVGGSAVVVGGSSSSGGNNSGGNSSGGSSGSSSVVSGGTSSCTIEDDGSGCVGEAIEGEGVPLDIYIMFDHSGSMCYCIEPEGLQGETCPDPACNQNRLDGVREAVDLFLSDPASAGIGLGIGYFGKQPLGQASCDVGDYSEAAVEIGQLPDNAAVIMDSLAGVEPTGETPTGAAIRGACDYVTSWKEEHPGRQTVILLLTDGKPEAPTTCRGDVGPCCPTLLDAVDAAAECFESDALIKTYVLGVGPLLRNLEEIAIAGGTEHAYLVEGGNVSAQVLDALNSIRGAALPCQFELPAPPLGETLALDQVNITYANAACEPSHYYYVETFEQCGDEGGWYYDDPAAPERVELCPTSCDQVSVPGGRMLFTVGCETRIPIR